MSAPLLCLLLALVASTRAGGISMTQPEGARLCSNVRRPSLNAYTHFSAYTQVVTIEWEVDSDEVLADDTFVVELWRDTVLSNYRITILASLPVRRNAPPLSIFLFLIHSHNGIYNIQIHIQYVCI